MYITQGHICCYFKHQTGRQHNTLRRKKQLPHVTRQRPVHTCMHKQNPTNKTENWGWQFAEARPSRVSSTAPAATAPPQTKNWTANIFDEYYEKYPSAGDTIDIEMTMRCVCLYLATVWHSLSFSVPHLLYVMYDLHRKYRGDLRKM